MKQPKFNMTRQQPHNVFIVEMGEHKLEMFLQQYWHISLIRAVIWINAEYELKLGTHNFIYCNDDMDGYIINPSTVNDDETTGYFEIKIHKFYINPENEQPQRPNNVWVVTWVSIDDHDWDWQLIDEQHFFNNDIDAKQSIMDDYNTQIMELNIEPDFNYDLYKSIDDMEWRSIGTIEYPCFHFYYEPNNEHYYVTRLTIPQQPDNGDDDPRLHDSLICSNCGDHCLETEIDENEQCEHCQNEHSQQPDNVKINQNTLMVFMLMVLMEFDDNIDEIGILNSLAKHTPIDLQRYCTIDLSHGDNEIYLTDTESIELHKLISISQQLTNGDQHG